MLWPNAQVQRRRSEAQGTNTAGVGVRCNAQLGWWQWAECAGSETAHEATAWCARCADLAASVMNIAMPPPLAYGVSHALTRTSIYLTAPCATVTPTRRPHGSVARTTAEGQAAHKPDEHWAFRRPNARGKGRPLGWAGALD